MGNTTSSASPAGKAESAESRLSYPQSSLHLSWFLRIVYPILSLIIFTHYQSSAASVDAGVRISGLNVEILTNNPADFTASNITKYAGKYIKNSLPDSTDDGKTLYKDSIYTAAGVSSLSNVQNKAVDESTACGENPTVSVSKDGDLNCTQTSVKITASATPNEGATYDWILPNGANDPGDASSFSTSIAGVYTVTVKYPQNDCIASNSITVTADETECCLTITNPEPANSKTICEGESISFAVKTNALPPVEIGWVRFDSEVEDPYTATGNGKTYLSSAKPLDGFASITSDNFPAVAGSVKTYYVYACFKYASPYCKGVVKYQVDVLKPEVRAVGGSFSCPITAAQLTAIGSPKEGVTAAYAWTGPGNFTSDSQNPAVTAGGSYAVTYSVTKDEKTCTVSDTAIIDCCPVGNCVPIVIKKTHSGE